MRSYRVGDEPIPGYTLLKKLGSGGFGEVWKASAPGGAELALKIINLNRKQGYKEFRALHLIKHIHHPNLTPTYAFWLKDEDGNILDQAQPARDALLMPPKAQTPLRATMVVESPVATPAELLIAMGLGSMSLYDRLMQCRSQGLPGIPPGELLEYMEEAAKAIDFLNSPIHDLGNGPIAIQHCDIKPQNILLVGNSAQVCDFGLARGVNDIRTSGAAGSPAYSPPECISANKPSPQTDQYSLAISYFELRTGELPFEDDSSYMAVASAHLNGTLVFDALSEDERKVIKRATSIDPKDRYETTMKMVRALRRACPESDDSSAVVPPSPTSHLDVGNGYRLVECLGRGSGEEAWAAVAPGGRKVAVLVRDLKDPPTTIDQQALTLILSMRHSRLAEVQSWWFLDRNSRVIPEDLRGTPSTSSAAKLVMAGRLAAGTLAQRLQECREQTGHGIPPDELLRYMEQLAEAIDFLNSLSHKINGQIVSLQHCNLRPINFLLDESGARLGNFALAKVLSKSAIAVNQGSFGAESPYVAPEVFGGHLTTKSDQYVFAVSYAHLRTGKLPFDAAGSTRRIIEQQRSSNLDLTGLTFAETEAVRRAINENPDERWPNCREFVAALRFALQPAGGQEVTTTSDYFSLEDRVPGGTSISSLEGQQPESFRTGLLEPSVEYQTAPALPLPVTVTKVTQTTLNDDEVAQPVVRRRGKRMLAAGLLLAAGGGSAAAVFLMLPSGVSPQQQVEARISDAEFNEAWKLATASSIPADQRDSLKQSVASSWREHLDQQLQAAIAQPAEGRGESLSAVEQAVREYLENVPDDPEAQQLLARIGEVQLKDSAADLDESLIAAEALLDADQAPEAVAAFTQLLGTGKNVDGAIQTRALFGRARANLRQAAWDDAKRDLQALHAAESLEPDQQHLLAALNSIAATHGSTLDLDTALQSLPKVYRGGQLDPAIANSPESAGLQQAKQTVIQELLNQPAISDDQRKLLTSIQPDLFDIQPLLVAAEQALAAQDYATARSILQDVQKRQGTRVDPQVSSLTTLTELQDPQGDIDATVQTIEQAVATGSYPRRLHPIAIALAERATALPDLHATALEFLREASIRLDGDARAEVEQRRIGLLNDSLVRQAFADAPIDFAKLLKTCEEAENAGDTNPLVGLIHAECMLETASTARKLDYSTSQTAIAYCSQKGDLDPSLLPYAKYVRAAVYAAAPGVTLRTQMLDELDELVAAIAADPSAVALQNAHRRQATADLLKDAGISMRSSSSTLTAEGVLNCPFGEPDNAEQAHRFLKTAQELLPQEQRDSELNAVLALAAFHRPGSDPDEVQNLLGQLGPVEKLNDEDKWPLLMIQACSPQSSDAGKAAALQAGATLAEELLKSTQIEDEQAKLIYDKLVISAISQADSSVTAASPAGTALAKLYAAKGRLVHRHKHADWGLDAEQRSHEVIDAYTQAIELDPERGEYYTGRGKAYLAMDVPDLESAVSDAKQALDKDPALPHAQGLLGHCEILLSRQAANHSQQLSLLQDAIAHIEKAVQGSSNENEELAIHHINLSVAYVELASNINDPTYETQKSHLDKARSHAELAIAANRRHPEYAYRTLGNAYEDLAWMIGQVDPTYLKYYDNAIEAFDAAILADLDDAASYMSRARCNYKRVFYNGQDKKYLDAAEKDLLHIVDHPSSSRSGQVQYWLGKVKAAQADWKAADGHFARAFEIEGPDQSDSALYAFELATNMVRSTHVKAAERAEEVRKRAESLRQCRASAEPYDNPSALANWLDGLSWDIVGDHAKAEDAFSSALSDDAESNRGYAAELLLKSRAGLRLKTKNFAGAKSDGQNLAEHFSGETQAIGYGYAGMADFRAAAEPGGSAKARESAKDNLRKAIQLAPKTPLSVEWRNYLVAILDLELRSKTPPSDARSIAKEAVTLLDDAIKLAVRENAAKLKDIREEFLRQHKSLLSTSS